MLKYEIRFTSVNSFVLLDVKLMLEHKFNLSPSHWKGFDLLTYSDLDVEQMTTAIDLVSSLAAQECRVEEKVLESGAIIQPICYWATISYEIIKTPVVEEPHILNTNGIHRVEFERQ